MMMMTAFCAFYLPSSLSCSLLPPSLPLYLSFLPIAFTSPLPMLSHLLVLIPPLSLSLSFSLSLLPAATVASRFLGHRPSGGNRCGEGAAGLRVMDGYMYIER